MLRGKLEDSITINISCIQVDVVELMLHFGDEIVNAIQMKKMIPSGHTVVKRVNNENTGIHT